MYFIELEVNQGSATLTSTDRDLAPRLRASSARESSLPRCPFERSRFAADAFACIDASVELPS
jgi:hypothetical protein